MSRHGGDLTHLSLEADLVAVEEDGRAGQGEEQQVVQLHQLWGLGLVGQVGARGSSQGPAHVPRIVLGQEQVDGLGPLCACTGGKDRTGFGYGLFWLQR